ncbi:MAG: InlB B-repeat-containing protein [Ruminococcus sp.]|nr:InlB B-repeat-containing protein [Ruminococcus sp.]
MAPLDIEGDGTLESPYLIKSTQDWDAFTGFMEKGGVTDGLVFRLENSITVSTMAGTSTNPFAGIFDGNMNKLTLDLSSSEYFCAPFSQISGATIKNLRTDGTVNCDMHGSGLVGAVSGTKDNLIENCVVDADINCAKSHCGGFVGHGGGSSKTTLSSCVFGGSITGEIYAGTLWGWSDNGSTPVLKNCLDLSDSPYRVGQGEPRDASVTNVYYTNNKIASDSRPWTNIGKLAHTVKGDGFDLSLSGSTGIEYSGAIYAGNQDRISLTVPSADGTYIADKGAVSRNGSTVNLYMPNDNVTVTKSTASVSDASFESGTSGNKNEGPVNMLDENEQTKWCVSGAKYPVRLVFKTDNNTIPKGYILTTANDAVKYPGRNPVSWKLEGSENGNEWTTLSEYENSGALEAKNYENYTFGVSNPENKRFGIYRLTINQVGSGSTFQLADIRLLGDKYMEYDLWVGSTQVTSDNKDDILGDGGKAKFDPETGTLTLDDPTIEGSHEFSTSSSRYSSTIVSERMDLTIKGRYVMTEAKTEYGIAIRDAALTLDGDFVFLGNMTGVRTDKSMTVRSGSLRTVGKSVFGIYSLGGLSIKGGVNFVDASGYVAILSNKFLNIDDGLVLKLPENGVIGSYRPSGEKVVCISDGYTYANHALIGKFFDVNFELNGHGEAIESQSVVRSGKAVKPADPEAEGYTFGGWYTDEELKNPYDFTSEINGGLTLYARWTVNTYKVSFSAEGGFGGMKEITAEYGDELFLPECGFTAPEGMEFDRWEQGAKGDKITIKSDTVIKAVWKPLSTEPATTVPAETTTAEPTTVPTESTTAEPTTVPAETTTAEPATDPTESTTAEPTTVPAETTTAEPATDPTESTTAEPITKPTEVTTAEPTTEPTEVTTAEPATEPTEVTTAESTTEPTEATTAEPATEPTEVTTVEPTTEPTEATTAEPTTVPTEVTTAEPITVPTETTTAEPATEPTTAEPATEPTTAEPATKPVTQPATPTKTDEFKAGADVKAAEQAISKLKNDKDPENSVFGLLTARVKKVTKNSVTITWTKPKGAEKYIIFGNKCGKTKGKFNSFLKLKTTKKSTITLKKIKSKKLKKGTYYKFLVLAVKGSKVVSTAKTLHVATKGGKSGNYKKVKLNSTKKALKKGKTFKLKATAVPESKKRKVASHRKIQFESSNPGVATVTSKGVIKAKKKGTCFVYAYAQSGVYNRVKITVK